MGYVIVVYCSLWNVLVLFPEVFEHILSQVNSVLKDVVAGHLCLTGHCHRSSTSDRTLSQVTYVTYV